MQKHFITKLVIITAAGAVWGAGPARALESPKSASIGTPSISVPVVSTPLLATPGESASVDLQSINLPADATIDLNGAVDQSIGTPEATPALHEFVVVPSLTVDSLSAGGQNVDSQKANVDMPANASASESNATMTTADNGAGTTTEWTDSSWDAEASAADRDASVGADIS